MPVILKPKKRNYWISCFQVEFNYQRGLHLPILDSIRGVAIVLVLLFHCFPYVKFLNIGWFGVDLFFVLSGFLITGILIDTVKHKHYWRNFAGRRILRIFPLYYLSLLLFLLINILFSTVRNHEAIQFSFFINYQYWYWLYIPNWLVMMQDDWLPTAVLNHFWSLAIEEQFYLLWPVLVMLIYKRHSNYFIIIPIVLILLSISLRLYFISSGTSAIAIYNFTFTRLDAISSGAIAALVIRNKKSLETLQRYILIIFTIIVLLYIALVALNGTLSPISFFFLTYGYTLNAFVFACFIIISLANHRLDFLKKLYDNQFFRYFGKYSYALYVFHWPIYRLFFDDIYEIIAV